MKQKQENNEKESKEKGRSSTCPVALIVPYSTVKLPLAIVTGPMVPFSEKEYLQHAHIQKGGQVSFIHNRSLLPSRHPSVYAWGRSC
jgi:hypothetical protein